MSSPSDPKSWLARAGRHGQDEALALEEGLAIIGFSEIPDLASVKSIDEIAEMQRKTSPDSSERSVRNFAAQLASFVLRMEVGDIVVLPTKTRPGRVALGRVTGPYEYREVGGKRRHVRPVDWQRPEVPRTDFQQDLIYSMGAFMTVCRIKRNDGARRFSVVLQGKKDPGPPPDMPKKPGKQTPQEDIEVNHAAIDVEELAHSQIVARIEGKFRGHNLERLVQAILSAEGYVTQGVAPGADGGVDILAGRGGLGFESPRLCVQVKSSGSEADVTVLRALQGSMQTFGADQGLLVSWGGFKKSVREEARKSYFTVRLWESGDLVEAIYRTYDRLPEEVQAELPLKKVWALVLDEEDQ